MANELECVCQNVMIAVCVAMLLKTSESTKNNNKKKKKARKCPGIQN
jgi:hypothetical protein